MTAWCCENGFGSFRAMSAELLRTAVEWQDAGHRVAIATVVETWGSSPLRPGSRLVVRDDMLFLGSVSGGCVEAQVVEEALEVMKTGVAKRLSFGVSNDEAWEVGLACGGTIDVLVALPPERSTLDGLLAAVDDKRAVVLATDLVSGEHDVLERDVPIAAESLDRDEATRDDERFLQPFNPPLRMYVVGAVHIAQSLAPMAAATGFDVTLIDPRGAFTRPERFADVTVLDGFPDEVLTAAALDRRSAVVLLSHDPKIDDPALRLALASNAFYVGALGSRKTHKKRVERLRVAGLDDAAIARIRAPIGLDIGARSPAEIAVAILGEITAALRGRLA